MVASRKMLISGRLPGKIYQPEKRTPPRRRFPRPPVASGEIFGPRSILTSGSALNLVSGAFGAAEAAINDGREIVCS